MAAILRNNFKNIQRIGCFHVRCLSFQAREGSKGYTRHLLFSEDVKTLGKLSICSEIELHVKACIDWQERGLKTDNISAYFVSPTVEERLPEDYKDILKCTTCYTDEETQYSTIALFANISGFLEKYGPNAYDSSKLLIEVPHFYNIDINMLKLPNKVTVEKLEGDIQINTIGDCILSQLKSQSISVNTTQGSITGLSSLIGDIMLRTAKEGSVSLDKVQGTNIELHCEDGDVRIKSLYGGDIRITSGHGDIHIGDSHGNISLNSSNGNVTVGSMLGQLTSVLDHGTINAKITSGGNINATVSNGDAVIKIDENMKCHLDLCAKSFNISPDFSITDRYDQRHSDNTVTMTGTTNGLGEQEIKVNCPQGDVKLLKESWFVFE